MFGSAGGFSAIANDIPVQELDKVRALVRIPHDNSIQAQTVFEALEERLTHAIRRAKS